MSDIDRSFHRATADDLASLLPMVEEFYRGERIAFQVENTRGALLALFEEPARGAAWILQSRGEIVGYFVLTFGFILEFGGAQAVLDELYLLPAFRAQGHGRAAVEKAKALARAAGAKVLRLEVDVEKERLQSTYRKAGFERHARFTMTCSL